MPKNNKQQVTNRKQQQQQQQKTEKDKRKEEKKKTAVVEKEEEIEEKIEEIVDQEVGMEEEETEEMEEKSLPRNFIARLDKKHNVAQKFFITAGAIIVVPFVVMFAVYQFLVNPYTMEKPLNKNDAITYAGITGIVVTILIQVGYMMMAIHEGDNDKEEEKSKKNN